jgi:hypothetical protein
MAKKRKAHLGPHKYKKVKWGDKGTEIFRCFLTNCPHYLHPQFVEGKLSLCWSCDKPCYMNKARIAKVKPICDECLEKKRKVETSDDLDGLIGSLE